jgi:parallel beta-helix repeat protein
MAFIFSYIAIIEETIQVAKAASIIYVDDVPGEGPDNPPENYTKIQDAINNAISGDTIFVYNGTYYERVTVNRSIKLFGESKDNTTIDAHGGGYGFRVLSNGVEIAGFTITGSSGGFEAGGIRLWYVDNCIIYNNKFVSNSFTGICVYDSNNNNISNNNFSSNFDLGIYLDNSCENSIINNSFYSNRKAGLLLGFSNENNIEGNNFTQNDLGIWTIRSDDNLLINNILTSNDRAAFASEWSCENTYINNTMAENGFGIVGDSIQHFNTHNIDISNTVSGKPVYYWKNITGGTIPSGAGQVILANCKNITVSNQEIENGTFGIELAFSSNITIIGNEIASNNMYGIAIAYSQNNIIIGNNIYKNDVGIFLYDANANEFKNNSISSNTLYGINILHSKDNTIISNNIIFNEGHGIDFDEDANNNYVYHNNFIDNGWNAWDYGENNTWDNGYPSGGNFWSDYEGEDLFKGPGQNISGSDGIGDTPYTYISDPWDPPTSKDNYPFKYPLGNFIYLYEGWNLISIPHIQSSSDLDSIFKSIKGAYDAVQFYNSTDINDLWKHNHILKDDVFDDLWELDHKKGIWIHVTKPGGVLFEYFGNKPTVNQNIKLYPGWNLVGYPSLAKYNRTLGLNNIEFGQDINAIQWFDGKTKTWHNLDSNDVFIRGRGYWIHSNSEITWEVPL